MYDRIIQTLKEMETQKGFHVLFACESGSRAWGFASPDSDYDVRFIYAYPIEWHIRLEHKDDVIEAMLPDKLDLSGWELGKALRLFHSCNLALNEWLGSPQIYWSEEGFLNSLTPLIPSHFNPIKAIHHYYAIAQNMIEKHLEGEVMPIKKLFYVLRPLVACEWILNRQTMPPTPFIQLVEADHINPEIVGIIRNLLKQKQKAIEGEKVQIPQEIMRWIKESRARVQTQAEQTPKIKKPDWTALNAIMTTWTPMTSWTPAAQPPQTKVDQD